MRKLKYLPAFIRSVLFLFVFFLVVLTMVLASPTPKMDEITHCMAQVSSQHAFAEEYQLQCTHLPIIY